MGPDLFYHHEYNFPNHEYIFPRRVDVRQAFVKIFAESLSQHDEKQIVLTPFRGIKVGRITTVFDVSAQTFINHTTNITCHELKFNSKMAHVPYR
jgi:hypothetical protein